MAKFKVKRFTYKFYLLKAKLEKAKELYLFWKRWCKAMTEEGEKQYQKINKNGN